MKTTFLSLVLCVHLFAGTHAPAPSKSERRGGAREASKVTHYGDNKSTHKPHWGYPGQVKDDPEIIPPEEWWRLNELCREKRKEGRQSPVNIPMPTVTPKSDSSLPSSINLQYYKAGPIQFDVFHNRHTIQASVNMLMNSDEKKANKIHWKGTDYTLKQFHIHAPSEHLINGKKAPMEIHFVHQSADEKNYVVLGVMVEISDVSGVANLQPIVNSYDPNRDVEKAVQVPVHPEHLMPGNRSRYVTYEGSLTTPPCSENVHWVLFQDTLKISQKDWDALKAHGFGVNFENFRPEQPLSKNNELKYHLE